MTENVSVWSDMTAGQKAAFVRRQARRYQDSAKQLGEGHSLSQRDVLMATALTDFADRIERDGRRQTPMDKLPSRERAAILANEMVEAVKRVVAEPGVAAPIDAALIVQAYADGQLELASEVEAMRERAAGEVGGCISSENEWWMNGYLRTLAERIRALPLTPEVKP